MPVRRPPSLFLYAAMIVAFAAGCGTETLASGPPEGAVDAVGDSAITDASVDAAPVDAGDIAADVAPACPGAAGCACSKDSACPGSVCAPSAKGKVCAALCKDTCSPGFVCKTVQVAGQPAKACLARNPTICDPCVNASHCANPADPAAQCVAPLQDQTGNSGWFCAPQCATTTDCPTGFQCAKSLRADGISGSYCMAQAGQCPCSPAAIAGKAKTTCAAVAKDGKGRAIAICNGERTCGSLGLSNCTAPTPIAETCDGLDNNCNDQKDEGAICDDNNACTVDACNGSAGCGHVDTTAKCDDGNPCTDDACDPKKGCTNAVNTDPCNDGTACTQGDQCQTGACKGTALTCDDANPCSDDSCDKAKGCVFTNVKKPCNDANTCTTGDTCAAGKCSGFELLCDDKNPCTEDGCDPASGCTTTVNDDPCNDNTVCTSDDACTGGKCIGQSVPCDDGNGCTKDVCDPKLGCMQTAMDGQACDDGNPCTVGEMCKVATCLAGLAKACDDGNPCTFDTCLPLAGGCTVTVAADGKPCSDGSLCTTGDVCTAGACAGNTVVCDDNNECTQDFCHVELGCAAKAVTGGKCDDGNPCTQGDVCKSGSCTAGVALDGPPCPDNKTCVEGTCK